MRMAINVTDAIICAPGAFMPSNRPASAAGMTPVSRVQHMNNISLRLHLRAAVRQRTQEHRHRPRHQHEDGDHDDAARQILTHQTEIDLGAEQDENKQPHDECGGHHIFIELLRLARLHLEAE